MDIGAIEFSDPKENKVLVNVRNRLNALSDSSINKMYYENYSSRGFSVEEKRFALCADMCCISAKLKSDRKELGLTLSQMARMLGYQGKHTRVMMHDLESGKRSIRLPQLRLMMAYTSGYRPSDWPK